MTDLREAAKLALEALEEVRDAKILALELKPSYHETIAALKRALAEDAMDKMAENARELGLDYDQGCRHCNHPLFAGTHCKNCGKVFEEPVGKPLGWLYSEGFEALKQGKCWTVYGRKQDADCNIPVYFFDAVAPRVEPAATQSGGGFESLPASPVATSDTSQQRVDKAEDHRHEPTIGTEIGKDISPDLATVGEVGVWGEPVAWMHKQGNYEEPSLMELDDHDLARGWEQYPLYTHPQQCPNCASLMEQNTELDKKLAEWVGLTEEEIWSVVSRIGTANSDVNPYQTILDARAIEAKLKEKNR